ncbi:hypothetical protein [Sphingomonas sp. BAUL-RG-20F-R05-02]|uniref:hypothetical protein n=1 Tax=Sphingomonas sp. BAUL-RG-20F-R05-02 TaxID=2914830 RepID=UPI001F5964ED|nr:hypothetical protein [Sphingomonas sp. BAUL-RG-20F-R05-02]
MKARDTDFDRRSFLGLGMAALIVINSVSPGYVRTDLTGHNGFMTAEEGAKLPLQFALLGKDAVSGRFVEAGDTPW